MTDERLFQSFLDGDEVSFNELMERYGDRIINYIAGRIEEAQEAEDLMIEAFARIVAAKPVFKEEGTFRSYLFKTARTVAVRFNKSYHLHRHFSFEELEIEPAAAADHERSLYKKERSRILHQCMEQLKPDYREALYLHYFEEMNLPDIASVMGRSRIAVEHLLDRSRKTLRELMIKEGINDAYD